MIDPTFRLATAADAAALAEFGERTFRQTFATAALPDDLDAYCAVTYGADVQGHEIADPGRHVLLALEGDEVIGQAQLRAGRQFPCVTGAEPIELLRFYVARRWHGRGIAARLVDEVTTTATARGARTMYLAVFEHNLRARAFYAKYGFVEVGSAPFQIGRALHTDLILARAIDAARIPRSA